MAHHCQCIENMTLPSTVIWMFSSCGRGGGAWGEHEELFMQLGHNCLYIWWWTIMKPSLLAYQCGERTSPHPDNFPGQFTPLGQFPTQTICSPSINTHNTYPPDNFPHQKNGTVMSGAEGLLEVEIV